MSSMTLTQKLYEQTPKRRLDKARNQKRYRLAHPQSTYRQIKNARLKRLYGITLAQYEEMLEKQGGVCALCGKHPSKNSLCVDHSHVTGRVRGLLCYFCNKTLWWIERHPQTWPKLYGYLKEPEKDARL